MDIRLRSPTTNNPEWSRLGMNITGSLRSPIAAERQACLDHDGSASHMHEHHKLRDPWSRLQTAVRAIYSQYLSSGPSRSSTNFEESKGPVAETSVRQATQAPRQEPRSLTYDGLRGLACWIVFNFHIQWPYTKVILNGYGVDDDNMHYMQLFPFNMLYRGRASVALFFGISGYVLSHGFLKSIRAGQRDQALSRLTSLTLRRWPRLYIPPIILMFLVSIGATAGLFDRGRAFQVSGPRWAFGTVEEHPPKLRFLDQMHHLCTQIWDWIVPWSWDWQNPDYNPHTWTIPMEFRGAMILFGFLLASARLKSPARMALGVMMYMFCILSVRVDPALFFGGYLVADLQLAVSSSKLSLRRRWRTPLNTAMLAAGLYALSTPENNMHATPGYRWMFAIAVPRTWGAEKEFWRAVGTPLVLWSVEALPMTRALLRSWPLQRFGRISFGFYLCQAPLLHSLGMALIPWLLDVCRAGDSLFPRFLWSVGMAIGYAIMLPAVLLAAWLFTIYVDEPFVRFLKVAEQSLWESEPAGQHAVKQAAHRPIEMGNVHKNEKSAHHLSNSLK